MISLIDKLIGRCIQLLEMRAAKPRDAFENFIEPTFKQFEKVHRSYIAAFKRARRTMDEAATFADAYTEIEKIVVDQILYEADGRQTLYELANVAQLADVAQKVRGIHLLEDFVTSIQDYLTTGVNVSHNEKVHLVNDQRWMSNLMHILSGIKKHRGVKLDEKRRRGTAAIDLAVAEMQAQYAKVSLAYTKMRVVYDR